MRVKEQLKLFKTVLPILLILMVILHVRDMYIGKNVDESSESRSISTNTSASDSKVHIYTGTLTAHFLDVGQADAAFVELPNGETMLIDAGCYSTYDKVITYIHQQGYDTIDYVVATHNHADHIGGMSEILINFNVQEFWWSDVPDDSKSYEYMVNALNEYKTEVFTGYAGDYIYLDDDLSIEIIAPSGPIENADEEDLNNTSLCLKISYGDTSFLFMGDAEVEEEETIKAELDCDVLKVAHHGSSSSSSYSFLKDASPSISIISCGADNEYGHPHDKTLNNLSKIGSEVLRTDELGDIVITSNGNTVKKVS